ncbi:hypothetical protein NMY22_g14556 [Coprinellus aureogranulatus]|nr:hypothetical protein NMY22_g14556 [Coprinellus aureogranulatus]
MEAGKQKLEREIISIETASRSYQAQLELTERELRLAKRDGELLHEEFDQLERSYKHAQEQCRKYQAALKSNQSRMDSQETAAKMNINKWFMDREAMGYSDGYREGYEVGKKHGKRLGVKVGREEGLREGIEQGKAEERRNAMDAIDQFLAEDGYSGGDSVGIRRTIQPEQVIDANVTAADVAHSQWKKEAGQVLGPKTRGIVLSLPGADAEQVAKELESSPDRDRILSLSVSFDLTKPDPSLESLVTSSKIPISLSTVYNGPSDQATEGLKWALALGRPVDIDVHVTLTDASLEGFEDTVGKATEGLESPPPIILSNILPPPHDLDLPIIKLMNHPTFLAFSSQVAALSLLPNVHIKFLPPAWDQPIPQTPYPGSPIDTPEARVQTEWKRRIKLYLGPVLEAFGYQRIIFGSSPSAASDAKSKADDWYEIARASLAELASDQEFVDSVFYGNANKVYRK